METKRKIRCGRVISDKMDKTVIVNIERRYPHPTYKKIIKDNRKYKVHNPDNTAHTGDLVEIIETRPLSKEKRWCIVKIIEKAKHGEKNKEEARV